MAQASTVFGQAGQPCPDQPTLTQALYRTPFTSRTRASSFPLAAPSRQAVTPMSDQYPRDAGLFDDLQRQAQRLRDLERDLAHSRLLLSSVPEAIVIADAEGRVNYWNDAAVALFGWTGAEMIGRCLEERFPVPTRAAISDILQSVRDGREFVGEWEDFRKDGSRVWIDTRIRGVTDSQNRLTAIVEIARDVTARKRAEHERHTLEARMMQVKKLESLGVLAGGVAHDFNNLLTSVLGNTDLALAHLPPSSPARAT